MDQFRQAKCTACAATFKVPGTFTANKAKCPKCGGVVEVGPLQSAAPKSAAPKAEASKAESAAAAPKPVPASVPPPKPAAAPQGAAPKPAAVAKPAAAAKPAAPSVRDAAASAASKVKSGAATPASSKSKKGSEDDGETEGKRSRHVHKEKSKAPMIFGAVFCLAMVGAAGWWFGVKLPADEKAKEEAAALITMQKREAADAKAAKDKAEMEASDAARLAAAGAAEQQKNGGAAPAATSEKSADKPATAKASDTNIVDDIDLTAFPELPKQSACSDEQWATLQDDARTLIDPAAGAKGNRAGKRLLEAGSLAVPALLNQFRTINPATDEGRKAGDLIQKTLERICNGRNFGWQYTTEPKDVVYNKKAIKNWFKIWETVGEDEQQWLGFTKQLPKDGEASKPAEGAGKAASGLDDF